MNRVLVTWVGLTDLLSMAKDLPNAQKKKVLAALKKEKSLPGLGPVRALVEQVEFDEIHLLCNYPTSVARPFTKWLGQKAKITNVSIKNPTDYASVFQVAHDALSTVSENLNGRQLCIHLSPGTPTMVATWVLLGKSKFPAQFFQTYGDEHSRTEIPFDLALDYVPELLRDADQTLQSLAERSPQQVQGFHQIVGTSKAIRLAVGRASKAAVRDIPVLIQGESGTGKEMFATAIHRASRRCDGPFIAINCAAIPRELLESELFGHRKGAFTGADSPHMGAFEAADGGTLFLDEVGECDPAMQAKLLRALQPPAEKGPCHRVFRRIGESKDRVSDVRIVAATNRNLVQMIEQHQFREDLYYRLAVIGLKLPALRDRPTDINLLAETLLSQINDEFAKQEPGYKAKSLTKGAKTFLRNFNWPGNVRQLHNALTQAAVMTERQQIRESDLSSSVTAAPSVTHDVMEVPLGNGFSLSDHLDMIQRHYIKRALEATAGVKSRARKLLGVSSDQTFGAQVRRLRVD